MKVSSFDERLHMVRSERYLAVHAAGKLLIITTRLVYIELGPLAFVGRMFLVNTLQRQSSSDPTLLIIYTSLDS
jgi:hypothetical protein